MGETSMARATLEYGGIINGVEVILRTKTAWRGNEENRHKPEQCRANQFVWSPCLRQMDL